MNSISPEAQPYALATAIMAVILLGALIRVWLLRRLETKLLKTRDTLEKQVVDQQRELMTVRKEANEWRAEMQRQFDAFRATASDKLVVEEKRFNELLKTSHQRQIDLQTALDIARQMCAELPAAKARVMQLEQLLEIDGGEGFSVGSHSSGGNAEMAPLPDLADAHAASKSPAPNSIAGIVLPKPAFPPVMPSMDESKVTELEQKLTTALQRNTTLQQALTAARLRSRAKTFSRTTIGRPQPLK